MFLLGTELGTGARLVDFGLTWWLQTGVLIAVGLLAASLLKRRGPAAQSAIYRATLVGVIVCPLLTLTLSSTGVSLWNIDVISRVANASTVDAGDSRPKPDRSPIETAHQPTDPLPASDPFGGPVSTPLLDARVAANAMVHDAETATTLADDGAIAASPIREPARPVPTALIVASAAVCVWLTGVLALVAKLTSDLARSRRLHAGSGSADRSTEQVCREIAGRLKVTPPEVRVTPFLTSPCLYGHWRPAVFLPEETPTSSYPEVFLHELAHLRRGDWIWSIVGRAAKALFWAQPMVWILLRRSSIVAEEVCDDYVLQYGGNREGYLERLVEIAEKSLPQPAIAGVTMVSFKSSLGQRAKRILDTTRDLSTTAGHRFACSALLAMLIVTTTLGLCYVGGKSDVLAQPVEGAADETTPATEVTAENVTSNSPKDAEPPVEPVTGKVLDPGGKPLAGVQLILERNNDHVTPNGLKHVIEVIDETTSNDDGSFSLDPGKLGRLGQTQIVAHAPGYGLAVDLSFKENRSPTIRLAKDTPIEGRIVDTEGQPIEGVAVTVLSASPGKSKEAVTEWIDNKKPELFADGRRSMGFYGDDPIYKTVFPGQGDVHRDSSAMPQGVVTGPDGRFRFTGIGHDRKCLIQFAGPTIAKDHAIVVTRTLKPFKAYDHRSGSVGAMSLLHHAASFTFVARPTQAIVGTVTDSESGEPIRGETVSLSHLAGSTFSLRSDYATATSSEQGEFQLTGVPLGGGHRIRFTPNDQSPYFETVNELPKTNSSDPIRSDFQLTKATWIEGRVTDQQGNPVKAIVQYYPYRDNSFATKFKNFNPIITGSAPDHDLKTDEDGNFRIRAIPGRGVLGARVEDRKQASEFLSDLPDDLLDRIGGEQMPKLFNPWSAKWYHVLREIEIDAGATEIRSDLTLTRGQTHTIAIDDPDGRPVSGVRVLGRVFPPTLDEPLDDNQVDIVGLSADDTRLVVLLQQQQKIGKAFLLNQDYRPQRIKLEPCATLSGRILDAEGEPASSLSVRVTPLYDGDNWGRSLVGTKTDENGEFSVLLPPGNRYRVWNYTSRGPNFGVRLTPKPGVSYSIGDLKHGEELDETETKKRLTAKDSRRPSTETLVHKTAAVEQGASANAPYVYEGQVLTPDGAPAEGAKVYRMFWYDTPQKRVGTEPAAITDAGGRFRFESISSPANNYGGGLIVVQHKPYAINWASATALETSGRLKREIAKNSWYPRFKGMIERDAGPIRLLSDDVTISGRLVDLEGNGVADATVSIEEICTGEDGSLDAWEELAATTGTIPTLQNTIVRSFRGPHVASLFPEIKTDQDGRFAIKGIGKDRIAKLVIRGQNIQAILAYARTNNGPRREIGMDAPTSDFWSHSYFGTNLSLVASPARPIIGKITDATTGKPIAGAVLTSMESYSQEVVRGKISHTRVGSGEVIARTDANGDYRLDGLPPANRTPLKISFESGGYMPRELRVDTRGVGVDAIRRNIKMEKAVRVTGRVVDAATGKGVSGSFQFLALPGERVSEFSLPPRVGSADRRGSFTCLIPRSDGNLCFRASDSDAFAMVDTPDAQRTQLDVFAMSQQYNLAELIKADESSDTLTLNLTVTPLVGIKGRAIAPDGSDLSEVLYFGRSKRYPRWYPSVGGELTVLGLKKGKTRRVAAWDRAKKLAGLITVQSDATDGFEVETRPWATVRGRVVDEDGEPLVGMRIYSATRKRQVFASPADAMKTDVSGQPIPLPPNDNLGNNNVYTDSEGRFELVGMIPDVTYHLNAIARRNLLRMDDKLVTGLQLKPGEERDLGDVVMKELPRK